MADERFFMDHGTIHDRVTGRHVRTDPDYGPGRKFEEDGIEECCALLNSLAGGAATELHKLRTICDEARAVANCFGGIDGYVLVKSSIEFTVALHSLRAAVSAYVDGEEPTGTRAGP